MVNRLSGRSSAPSTGTTSTTSTIATLVRNVASFSFRPEDGPGKLVRRVDLLPKEILHPILDLVYQDILASPCSCPRCATQESEGEARRVSLAHRVSDTKTLREICSAFHVWALYRITHPHGYERLEIDFSDFVGLCVRMKCPGTCLLGRLLTDFPLLGASRLVLYLGNPGNISNIRMVNKMLRMEPSDRVERMLVGGLSFWESDKSGRTSKSSVQKLATRDSHQPIFEPESDRSDQILFNTKALVKIERCWIRERSEELNSIVDIYHTIAESLSSSSYTQIPFAILKAGSPYASTSFRIFMRKCKHVVLREFRGLDEGNMTQYIHELYSLSEVEGLPQLQKLLLQPVITNTMWSLNKRLWPSERETWCQNLDAFETLPAYEGVGGHNIHLSLKSPHDKVYGHRVWHLLDDSVLLTPWAFCLANVSSLTLTGGVADNVTLFGLLTAMSATPDNLQSLTYLPEIKEAKKTTSKHSCPLFARFRSLVDVRLGCAFCPEALGASNSVATATKNKKRWRIDWPTAMPCLCWRERVEREKQITTTENPCTILATLLEDCRSAMYAVDGHYSKIFGACGTYTVKPWYLELNMRMERLYTSRKGLRGKLAFDIIFLPLSHPPQASVGLKGGDTKAWMVEDDVLGQWRNGEGWPGYLPPGGPQPYQIHDRLSWDIGK